MHRLVGALLSLSLLGVIPISTETAATAAVQVPAGCSSTPLRADPARHYWFRIPSIVQTGTGALLAFAERRDTAVGDLGNFDLVATRSTDGGCTWSPYRVVSDDAGNRVSNPVPLVDASTGQVLLFSVVSVTPGGGGRGRGLQLQTSSDDGVTFTPLLDHPVRPAGHYRGGLTGVGHGIQLSRSHPGRLLVPMGYRTADGRYGAYAIYSDDHGASWRTGFDQQDTTGTVQLIEGTVAELPDSRLFISFRNKHLEARSGETRQYAISDDGGASLARAFRPLPLKLTSVAGSALALKGRAAGTLLFSTPADPGRRRQMTVFVSTDGGASFPLKYPVELAHSPAAYSDLVQVGDDAVGVLFETGNGAANERIDFRRVPVSELTGPTLVRSTLTYERAGGPVSMSRRVRVLATVTVAGTTSPPGRLTLTVLGGTAARNTSVTLTYANRGVRYLTLPRLLPGLYQLRLAYSGTERISPTSVPAGTLRVTTG